MCRKYIICQNMLMSRTASSVALINVILLAKIPLRLTENWFQEIIQNNAYVYTICDIWQLWQLQENLEKIHVVEPFQYEVVTLNSHPSILVEEGLHRLFFLEVSENFENIARRLLLSSLRWLLLTLSSFSQQRIFRLKIVYAITSKNNQLHPN